MDYQSAVQLGNEILTIARNELYLSMRFLDVALSGLTFDTNPTISSTATDGNTLYFQPRFLLTSYEDNPVIINRAYMHNLLHCIFSHLYLPAKKDKDLWNLSCDICVESIIDSLDYPALRKLASPLREKTYNLLKENISLFTPGKLYHFFLHHVFYEKNKILLEQEFSIDTHEFWPEDEKKNPHKKKDSQKWQKIGDKTKTNMETFQRMAGTKAGNLLELLRITRTEDTDYEHFLKQFASWHETVKINPDEYDLAYYSLGLDLYGNIPFLEPVEYKEEKAIRDFVIAIDTSGSVQGVPIRNFLSETFGILQSSPRFLDKLNLHLIQFDTIIQDDIFISQKEELNALAKKFVAKGFGGTDYRCVFEYIDKCLQDGSLSKLQGLMILTDGYGTYPTKKPEYPVAFLLADFLQKDSHLAPVPYEQVPHWAIRLRIEQKEGYHGESLHHDN